MKVKTYGIQGLTEWHGKLMAGSIEVAVSFVGGTASPSGSQPAYMMTNDPIVQLVVEKSKEFKDGFIQLIMTQELPGNHGRVAMPKGSIYKNSNTPKSHEANTTAAKDEAQGQPEKIVEVASIEDARDFLSEQFEDVRKSDLRSKQSIKNCAIEHGVSFIGIEL
ncbi:MAG: hypothetical protein IJ764_00420 [Bacteroidales bacterium]|nr:hypothetical protein [Bacteroidales bacterium]